MTEATRFVRRNRVDEPKAFGIAVLGGLLAAAAGASPTGSTVVDVALVVIFAGAVVWASASAPWWAVTAAAGIGAVIALDPVVAVIGFIGFGLGLWLGVRRRDLAELRAVIGAIAVNVLIRSDLGGFLGLSAIVGVVVCIALFVLGVRRRPSRYRRPAWIVGAAIGVLAVVACLAAAAAAAAARSDLTAGAQRAQDGISALNAGDYEGAAALFADSADAFDRVENRLGGTLAAPALLVPGLAQNLSAGVDLSAAAQETMDTAAAALDQIELSDLRVVGGAIDLDAVRAAEQPLVDVQNALIDLRAVAEGLDSPWLVGRIQSELTELDDKLDENEPRLQNAVDAVQVAPGLLGGQGERRYLVMFTSPAELRGLAGFFGNYAEVTIDNGQIDVTAFGRRSELEDYVRTNGATCTACPQELIDRYGPFGLTSNTDGSVGARAWSNITMPAHFPYVGISAQDLYPQSGGRPIDGVIAMDPYVVQALMQYTGPVSVPELGVTVDPAAAADFIVHQQYLLADDLDNEDRIDGLETLGATVIERLLSGGLPEPSQLADDLGPLVDAHRLLVWTDVPEEQAFLDTAGMLGAMPPLVDDTGFAVFAANAGASKIDVFLDRDIDSRIVVDPDGSRRLVADVTLTNTSPATGLPDYVIGNAVGLPTGTSRLFVTFYGPANLISLGSDGETLAAQQLPEAGWTAYTIGADIGPGSSVSYHLEFSLPVVTTDSSEIADWVQPLARPS